MVDKIIEAILKAEEEANRDVSEASIQANKIRENWNISTGETFETIVASCEKAADESRQLAKQKVALCADVLGYRRSSMRLVSGACVPVP